MRMTDPLTAVELPEGGALCAVSGGLDSMCLLEMTVRQGQKQGRRVAAAHFNHQLRGAEADRDEAFVRDWCAAREIPFFAGRGDVRAFAEKTGRTVEEAARQTGIGRNTLRSLINAGKLPVLRIGRKNIIRTDVLMKFMEMNEGADLLNIDEVKSAE